MIKIRFQVQLEPIALADNAVATAAAARNAAARSKYTGFFQAMTTILKEEGVQVGLHAARGLGSC